MKTIVLLAALIVPALWGVRVAHSDTITQLNITGGSLTINLTSQPISGSFTQNGTLVMGQFQPPPNIFPPITMSGETLSFFTNSSGGLLPAPLAQTSGNTLTANLSSLFVGVAGPSLNAELNIGGVATGSYDPTTGAFVLSWTHTFTDVTSSTVSLQGIAVVPLPGSLGIFGAGAVLLLLFSGRGVRRSLGRAC